MGPSPHTQTTPWPPFSPNAEWLTYTDGRALLKVAISGGAPRPVVQPGSTGGNPSDNHWGDDGTIVFTHGNTGGLYRVPTQVASLNCCWRLETSEIPGFFQVGRP